MEKPDRAMSSGDPEQISLVIISDRLLVREGIVSLLSGEDDIKVVDRVSGLYGLMESLARSNPDIVIIDDCTDGVNNSECIKLISQKTAEAKVLLLIRSYDEDKELNALKVGVAGFLPENASKADFIRCLRGIRQGKMWIRREIMEKYIKQNLSVKTPQQENGSGLSIPYFTKRELEVVTLVSKGYKNRPLS